MVIIIHIFLYYRYCPHSKTVKAHISEKYGNDVIVSTRQNSKILIFFRNTGHKILTEYWYTNKKVNEYEERCRIIQTASDIICEDIRSHHSTTIQTFILQLNIF